MSLKNRFGSKKTVEKKEEPVTIVPRNEVPDIIIPAKPEEKPQVIQVIREKKESRTKIHQFSEENLLTFAKAKGKIKPYEVYWFFLDTASAHEIDQLIKRLFQERKLKYAPNHWIVVAND